MPTLLGAGAIIIGGMILLRLARREWARVNRSMESQRSAGLKADGLPAQKLARDPVTGIYRPSGR